MLQCGEISRLAVECLGLRKRNFKIFRFVQTFEPDHLLVQGNLNPAKESANKFVKINLHKIVASFV